MSRAYNHDESNKGASPRVILGGLSNHYRVIGNELLLIERAHGPFRYRSGGVSTQFRENMTCVSTQILESYLDDLLDREISEERLFIENRRAIVGHFVLPLIGVLLGVVSGLYASSLGAPLIISFCLAIAMVLPSIGMLYFAPRGGLMRRMAFAQIVSHEILRRRGGSDFESVTGLRGAGIKIGGMLAGQSTSRSLWV